MKTMQTLHHPSKEIYSDPSNIFRTHMGLRRKNGSMTGDVAKHITEAIQNYLEVNEVKCHGFIVLPDRMSFVLSPTKSKTIFDLMQEIQDLVTYHLPRSAVFFGDFLDHLLRKTEDPKLMAWELFQCAKTAGLVSKASAYPFTGSTMHSMTSFEDMLLAPQS